MGAESPLPTEDWMFSHRPRARRRRAQAGAAALAWALSGCATEFHAGETTVFAFSRWVPVLFLVATALFVVAGLKLRRKRAVWGWTTTAGGIAVALLVGPGLFLERVTVTPDRFTLRTGFWFLPTRYDIAFGDVSRIELTAETKVEEGGRTSATEYLVCYRGEGDREKVPVGDLMRAGGAARILQAARAKGIPVTDTR